MTMTRGVVVRLHLLLALVLMSAGCEVVAGIFKAGLWVGLILTLIVVAIIVWVIGKFRR